MTRLLALDLASHVVLSVLLFRSHMSLCVFEVHAGPYCVYPCAKLSSLVPHKISVSGCDRGPGLRIALHKHCAE